MSELKMGELFQERFWEDKDKYFIVIAFWQWVLCKPNDFKNQIHAFLNESGYIKEGLGCYFPNIFESPDEEGYFEEGVGFCGFDDEDEIVIDYAMFVKCVELAYSIYSEKCGRDDDIEKDIKSMHEKYSV